MIISFKKRFISAIMALVILACINIETPVFATNDMASSNYGFSVDLDYYKSVAWYNTIETRCYMNNNLIGICTTNIGVTRAKQMSSGQYMNNVFVRCAMKGKKKNQATQVIPNL